MYKNILLDHKLFENKNPINKSIQNIRNKSINFFIKNGIPTIKDEDWRYTNVFPIFKKKINIIHNNNPHINYNELKKHFICNLDTYRLVFINGIFHSFLSNIVENNNEFDILTLSLAFNNIKYKSIIESFYNISSNNYESFFSLNSAFSNEGTYIHIKKNVKLSKIIEIVNFTIENKDDVITHPRTLIVLENESKVRIIETHKNLGASISLTNYVCEIFIKKSAELEMYKIQNDNLNSQLIDYTSITQYKQSCAKVYTLSFGSSFIRNNLNFYHNEEYCHSILNGLTLIGKNQFVDNHTLVDHSMPNCKSDEFYRGIFNHNSQGIFNGKIIVRRNAQKINAFQKNNNLILSNQAIVNAKPQLEIFANDVKCSHGCTIGQLNKDIIFYLQSRGVPKKEAILLLNFSFLLDVFNSIEDLHIKNYLINLVSEKLKTSIDLKLI